jgi:L-lactate dehydrogenase complex protein LldG
MFDDIPAGDLKDAFRHSLLRMGGRLLESSPSGDPLDAVRSEIAESTVIYSTVPEVFGNRDLAGISSPRDLADVDYSIVRAAFGVAETGSVLLSERELVVNTCAYLAQHLIVLLDPADIVLNLHSAYRRPEFHDRNYASFHTGPSATADIEGVLIHGAQGVRSLSVLLFARNQISPG